ncbi:MAG: TorF family putative porin [Steroidobacteraceae bacterium]|nr:TorF family putative porin [Steroidobacteraceae bacterium]
MKLTKGFAALALLSAVTTANAADFSATITGTTDYDFRGVTQSAQDPAIQGSLDVAADNGLYAGVWASNIDWGSGDPNVEIDYYAGWGGGEDITWDLGVAYYTYLGASTSNYAEYYAGLGWSYFEAKVWYAPGYAGLSGKNERYFEGNVSYPLPANFGLTAHIGYTNGSAIKPAFGQSSYMDWSAGVTYSWKHIDMSLLWVDGSDMKTLKNTPDDIFSSEARAIFAISTTFPWSDE